MLIYLSIYFEIGSLGTIHTHPKKKKNRPSWNAIVRIKKRNIINERKFEGEDKARNIFFSKLYHWANPEESIFVEETPWLKN